SIRGGNGGEREGAGKELTKSKDIQELVNKSTSVPATTSIITTVEPSCGIARTVPTTSIPVSMDNDNNINSINNIDDSTAKKQKTKFVVGTEGTFDNESGSSSFGGVGEDNNDDDQNDEITDPKSNNQILKSSRDIDSNEEVLPQPSTTSAPSQLPPNEMIESHRDSKSKFIKPYPSEEIEKVVTKKEKARLSQEQQNPDEINNTRETLIKEDNHNDDVDEIEAREEKGSSSKDIDAAESSKSRLPDQEDAPTRNENPAAIPEITLQNVFQPHPKFVATNTVSMSSDVTPIVSPNNPTTEHIHDASLVTETAIYNNTNNRNLASVYPTPIDLPPQFRDETTNSTTPPFSEYFAPNFVSEDTSSPITYTSDPLEYPHQPRYPPSTGISRTQQKLMLQRQHFLADDENFLIHPRNQLRLTKVIERINREHASILLYRDPVMESIQRVMGKYARNHPEVLDEDFGASYDDNKDWERNKNNNLVPSSSSGNINSNENVGQSVSASSIIAAAESGKLKGK
ncbi:1867_t:CDS:2, partial [Ambispora gerdemannii]